jgi:putative PIN family toxin of toxin-antitoxin system
MNNRLVFDTNVLISHLLIPNSNPAKAVIYALGNDIILSSAELLSELERIIKRRKFDKYFIGNEREEFLFKFYLNSVPINIIQKVLVCRDPKDNMILELAVNGEADYVVTGDKDLLVLNPFRNIKINTPADYLKIQNLNSN